MGNPHKCKLRLSLVIIVSVILINKFGGDSNVKTTECAGYFSVFAIFKNGKTIINNRKIYY
jgi:hypothetical protein